MAMIDLILETAQRLGLAVAPRGLTDLHRAYLRDHPDTTVGRSQNSFDATLNYHVINMRSRFPKPREPRARAMMRSSFATSTRSQAPHRRVVLPLLGVHASRRLGGPAASTKPRPSLATMEASTLACTTGWKRTTNDSIASQSSSRCGI